MKDIRYLPMKIEDNKLFIYENFEKKISNFLHKNSIRMIYKSPSTIEIPLDNCDNKDLIERITKIIKASQREKIDNFLSKKCIYYL
jgi:broad-specificity NMP kinase